MTSDLRPSALPLSVLDLAIVGEGQSSGDALQASTALARHAEELGYTRFWVAEHHNMPAVASTSPPVLMAHVAAATTRIRVGSGGVMLPNHQPLVVAEQFAMLEALHPGRIDLGIGRAPGTDPATAAALRRSPAGLGVEEFPEHLLDLLAMLRHPVATGNGPARFAPTPAPSSVPDVLMLGSSGYSAELAGRLGLPFAFAHHFPGTQTLAAVDHYRHHFRPSAVLDRPYVIVTVSAIVAEDEQQARYLAAPSQLMLLALRTGRLRPLPTPEQAAEDPQREVAASLHGRQVVGTPEDVTKALRELAADSAADELMVSTITHGLDERARSLELLAEAW